MKKEKQRKLINSLSTPMKKRSRNKMCKGKGGIIKIERQKNRQTDRHLKRHIDRQKDS